jgi:hypothetical protein
MGQNTRSKVSVIHKSRAHDRRNAGVAILLAVFLRKPETDPAGDQRA